MMYRDVVYGRLEPENLVIDEIEFQRRIGEGCGLNSEAVLRCRREFDASLSCKFAYVKLELGLEEEGCDFGFMKIKSKNLRKNLEGCQFAYMMAVTLGLGMERLLGRLRIKSAGELLITDALASAAVEALCDYVDAKIRAREKSLEGRCRPRYSPGYGDCSIETQEGLLDRLNAEQYLGISLNDSFFMTPSKSITAIMGVEYK